MFDVRKELGVKSVRLKVEKRVLERIGHVMRLEDGSLVKSVTLGWLEELELYPKVPGKKRKTNLYWRKILREAGIDNNNISELMENRKKWKTLVMERVRHLQEWEEQGGKMFTGERIERNF